MSIKIMNQCWRALALAAMVALLACIMLVLTPGIQADVPVVHVSGTLVEDTSWTADTVYVIDADLTINPAVTLTVASGTVCKFAPYADLIVQGKLALGEEPQISYLYLPWVTNGASTSTQARPSQSVSYAPLAADPVVLTSLADDSVGGDTNQNGSATTPAMGDWGCVIFEDQSRDSSYMQGFEIRYSGKPLSSQLKGAILLQNASPYLHQGAFSDNYINGIEIPRGDWLNDVWDATGIVYHLTDNLTIPRGNTLRIPAGTIIKVVEHKRIIVKGQLQAIGTASKPVIMTSWRDESAGGATIAGITTPPAKRDWGGIDFTSDSAPYNGILDHVELRYTGWGLMPNTAAIQLHNCSPTLGQISFVDGFYHGVSLEAQGDQLDTLSLRSQTVPYIILDDLYIPRQKTLTIGPGVTIKLDRITSLHVEGGLIAEGTEQAPILLTSLKDDQAINDTNTDGLVTVPDQGDWGCIFFAEQSDDTLCRMRWVTLTYGGSDGLQFSTRMGPIRLDNAEPLLEKITLEKNWLNAVDMTPGAWRTSTWDNLDVVYYVTENLTVVAGHTLTIVPGMIVKVHNPIAPTSPPVITIEGALQVGALGAAPVVFTSGRNDAVGPVTSGNWDSNGDGTASAPATNDWVGITFAPGANGAGSYLHQTTFSYAGVRAGTFQEPHGAVRMQGVSLPVSQCLFMDNYRGIEALDGAAPTISQCRFENNTNYGVYNGSPGSATVQAINNWWNDVTGPGSDGQACNPAAGYGDRVSCGVAFSPWLTIQP